MIIFPLFMISGTALLSFVTWRMSNHPEVPRWLRLCIASGALINFFFVLCTFLFVFIDLRLYAFYTAIISVIACAVTVFIGPICALVINDPSSDEGGKDAESRQA